MDRTQLLQSLKEMLEEDRGEEIGAVDEAVTLREGLGLDSVDMITLVMQVEDRFGIVMETERLQDVVTVGDVLDLMQEKMRASSKAA